MYVIRHTLLSCFTAKEKEKCVSEEYDPYKRRISDPLIKRFDPGKLLRCEFISHVAKISVQKFNF